jgi:hypothetical protein
MPAFFRLISRFISDVTRYARQDSQIRLFRRFMFGSRIPRVPHRFPNTPHASREQAYMGFLEIVTS